ncbi:MAG: hypothetical protein R3344_01180 [Acidobacteriota bacterium]|nr:hypothetical protein [Acidobacteriota bacterium]
MRLLRRGVVVAGVWVAVLLVAPGSAARVDISLDAETLSEILGTLVPQQAEVPLLGESTMTVELDDFRVTGFDPSAGDERQGYVLTSLRMRVPALGIDAPVEPRLSLTLGEEDGVEVCFLTFEEVEVPVPAMGDVDIARFLPRVPMPVDSAFGIEVDRGDFVVRTKLIDVQMGVRLLRFAFDLDVTPAEDGVRP